MARHGAGLSGAEVSEDGLALTGQIETGVI